MNMQEWLVQMGKRTGDEIVANAAVLLPAVHCEIVELVSCIQVFLWQVEADGQDTDQDIARLAELRDLCFAPDPKRSLSADDRIVYQLSIGSYELRKTVRDLKLEPITDEERARAIAARSQLTDQDQLIVRLIGERATIEQLAEQIGRQPDVARQMRSRAMRRLVHRLR
jgi:hypothetical protein